MAVVELERHGQQAWITLNRPERKNTLVAESFRLLGEAWAEVRADPQIRVAVLTAVGEEDFCCGGDIGEYIGAQDGGHRGSQEQADYRAALLLDEPLYKPVVAAVNGRALGGGTELLGATDVRVAAEHAVFALPEVRIGIVPGAGSMVRLARQIPWAHAMRLMTTGDQVDAATALAWGLVSEVVPLARLQERAEQLAARIAANAPLAVQTVKRIALETHTTAWPDAFALEHAATSRVVASEDAVEGPAAFLAKRAPDFRGR